jgi:surfeit locus 1 family protein
VGTVWAALRTRRGLGLTLLMLVVVLACLWLGRWQWSRAQPDRTDPVTSGSAVGLDSVLQPRDALLREDLGRFVEVTGRYLPEQELVVLQRSPEEGSAAASGSGPDSGVWALSALRTDTGAVLPVVRGWAPDRASIPPPPQGRQTVRGVLQPSENSASAPRLVDGVPAADEVTTVSSAVLVGIYPTDRLYDGFLLLEPPSSGLQAVDPDVVPTSGWHLVNTGYALQWWVFAGFAVFMWARMLREGPGDDGDLPVDEDATDRTDRPQKEPA